MNQALTCRRTLVLAALAAAMPRISSAQGASGGSDSFPSRPVRWVVPTPPGSLPDVYSRQLAQKLGDEWRQSVVVENRPGAAEKIGMDSVVASPADGYTMMLGAFGMVTLPHMAKLAYDPLSEFTAVTKISEGPLLLVVSSTSPFNSLKDLVDYTKANPGKLSAASAGVGNILHLAMAMLGQAADFQFTHVPYSTSASQRVTDLMAGQVNTMFNPVGATLPFLKSGGMRVLAVTSQSRLAALPDVPTFRELGYPAVEVVGWLGVFVRSGTPPEIVQKMNGALVKALRMPDIRQPIVDAGGIVGGDTPQQFSAFVKSESAKWGKVIAAAGIRLE